MKKSNFTRILPKDSTVKDIQLEILNPIGATDTEMMELNWIAEQKNDAIISTTGD
jgi:hypothetical protein